jgi:feruloyl esterase
MLDINEMTMFARVRSLLLAAVVGFPGAAAAQASLAVVQPATACADLAGHDLTGIGGAGSRVTSATEGEDNGIAACIVEGTLAPAIGFRVSLPTRTWTQRYLQVGCGGLCGRITPGPAAADGCVALGAGGFVVAATDMGHQGPDASFGLDAGLREDFAFRAQHLTALAAKSLI